MSRSQYDPQSLKPYLVGVINMQLTPFKSDYGIDVDALRKNTHMMIERGIVNGRGVQVVGAQMGEGAYMTDEEYHTLIDVVVKEAAGRVPVGVSLIRTTTHEMVKLAKYAEEAGADFVMALPPRYVPSITPCPTEVVYAHYKALADAINIGIMVHNDPESTGLSMSVEMLNHFAEMDKIIAFKEDRREFGGLREIIYKFKDRFMINANSYKVLLPLDYQSGLTGYNSFLANVDPAYALKQHDLALSADFDKCQEFWANGLEFYDYMLNKSNYRMLELAKEMVRITGQPMGSIERLPFRRPDEETRKKLRANMEKIGMKINA